jgi:hypothetical protein
MIFPKQASNHQHNDAKCQKNPNLPGKLVGTEIQFGEKHELLPFS